MIKTLKKCIVHIQYFVDEEMDLFNHVNCFNIVNKILKVYKIMQLLTKIEKKLQCTLKCMIKLAMENTTK